MAKNYEKMMADAAKRREPVFILRASDGIACGVLEKYITLALNAGCSIEFCKDISARVKEIAQWQQANPGLVKIPD